MSKTSLIFLSCIIAFYAVIPPLQSQEITVLSPAEVKYQEAYTTTIPLRDMDLIPSQGKTNWKNGLVPNKELPGHLKLQLAKKVFGDDPVIQEQYPIGPSAPEAIVQNFEGISNTYGVAPPDTHGDVGLNHYIQMVNNGFQIFDKSGNALTSATTLSTLWNNLPGPWNGTNNGDPVVLYDETENRWIMTQFSLPNYPNGTFYELLAISSTSNPLDAWHLYAYSFSDMPDYPKFGVWHDGLYMSINRFASGSLSYAGTGAVAFEKSQMLLGMPAQMIYFTFSPTSDPWSFLPADLDGPAPSVSLPNYFTYVDYWSGTDRLRTYYFASNWVSPASSTFTGPYDVNVASINNNFTTDIVQPGTSQTLDPLEDRLMYRLQFRDFGTYRVMLTNHTVNVGSNRAGIRWYELRNYGSGWALHQQGTYAPSDSHSRWVGSIAMNRNGDIALGYSISSSSLAPSIRYAGRLSTDSPGTMGQPETTIVTGSGNQTGTYRWGDYSMMSVDPVDDYTFWYTQEYVNPGGNFAWNTRVASFTFGSAPVADVWTGMLSGMWSDPNNWSDGSVPYRSDDVVINSSTSPPNWPIITGNLITGLTCNNLVLNGTSNLTVTGTVEVTEGTSLTSTGNSTIYAGGNWIINGQFAAGTGTVMLNGISGGTVNAEPQNTWVRPTIFEENNGQAANYFDIVTNSNDISIDAFDINTSSTSAVTVEIWYRTDSYVGNTGSITGWNQLGSPKIVTGNGADLATHVIPDMPLVIPAGSTYGVFISCYSGSTGYLRYTNGAFNFFDPNITINTGAAATGLQPGSGTVFSPRAWNGTVYYTTNPNPALSFYDLVIDKTDAEVSLNCDVSVMNDLTVSAASFLTNANSKTLNVGNDFTLATSSGRTGSFINNGTLNVAGSTFIEKMYTDSRWHFISSPVTSEVSGLFTGLYLKYWNEPTYSWEYIIAPDSLLRPGLGYEIWSTLGNPTISYTLGGVNAGTISPLLKATDSNGGGMGATEGWNLVGNPYTSAIDLGTPGNALPGYTWNNLDYTVYVWNGVNYDTYNPFTGISNNASRYIPAMQAFFIKANALNPVLQFPASAATHSTQANYKSKSAIPHVKLLAEMGNYSTGFLFGVFDNASPGYDGPLDAYHLEGLAESPEIYQMAGGDKLGVNLVTEITPETQIALGYKPGTAGIHAIGLAEMEGLDEITHVVVEDIKEGIFTNLLLSSTYQFVAHPNDDEHRFNLYFNATATGTADHNEPNITLYSDDEQIFFNSGVALKGIIQVYNIPGQLLLSKAVQNENRVVINHQLPAGVYLVKGIFEECQVDKKLFIK